MNYFKNTISNEQELRSILGFPSDLVRNKVIAFIDKHCSDIIAKSPFLLMSTSDNQGFCDVSPRGDMPGFVMVLDQKHLIIPERLGNRRVDSLRNIMSNGRIGLIFIIPGLEETLRINGRAYVVRDEELLIQMEVKGRMPMVGIGVEVEECYVHCAKAFKRSNLWNPDTWLHKDQLPNMGRALSDHAKMDAAKVYEILRESYTERLY